MRKTFLLFIILTSIIPYSLTAQKNLPSTQEKEIMAARQVMMRLIGMKSEAFSFEKIQSENGLDVYEVNAKNGKILVKGSSTIAMTRGAYEYLKQACNVQYTWSTEQLTPPSSFPDFILPRTISPFKYRQYYNVCTFGYSTAFWNWEQWQKELDWMALHGINMPLAMGGQEAVWQKVFKDMGFTEQELRNHFAGPAFLPWQRMGNVNKHGGPLPQSYIDGSRDLQKQVMIRMQQLGMEPIVPAFSGFVPEAYKRLYPDARLLEVKGWCSFPDTMKAYLLSPGSSDFINIGKRFIEEYQRTYGKTKFYLADLFNENEVPVTAENKQTELAEFGKSVFDAIQAGDPQGTWVMQGWLFHNNAAFWDKEAVKALLSKVPNDRMLIIDLANEEFQGWKKHDGFYGKPWIYSIIHNYGGNNQLIGNLPVYASGAGEMLTNPGKGNISGFGISPEGIRNNEVVYELLSDVAWSAKPVDIKAWLKSYVKQRYGRDDDQLFLAWLGLLESVYMSPTVHPINAYQNRPSMNPSGNLADSKAFDAAVAKFLVQADQYMVNPRFRNDLVQLVVQFAGMKTDYLISRALQLHQQGQSAESADLFEKVKELMLMMDALTNTLPQQRLETWIEEARKWGKTKQESDYFEANAKRQVTQWGTPVLYEYASKVWSGLIRDYYLNRWMNFEASLKSGSQMNLTEWEENWIKTPGLTSKAPVTGDILSYARALYNAAGSYALKYSQPVTLRPKNKGQGNVEVSFHANPSGPAGIFEPLPDPKEKKEKKEKKEVKKETGKAASIPEVKIYYSLDGSNPGPGSPSGDQPVSVTLPATVKAMAYYDHKPFGSVTTLELPVSFGKPVTLSPLPSSRYAASAGQSLTDGIKGTTDFKAGNWLGFEGDNLFATINLGSKQKISEVTVSYMESGNSWIFGPSAIVIHTSENGVTFTPAYSYDLSTQHWSAATILKSFKANFPETEAQYVRVTVFNQGTCPSGSACEGKKSWLFVDELSVK